MAKPPTKVFLLDDSPIALAILKRLLDSSPDVEVVGTANNGKQALEEIPKLQPEVVCTDFHMKGMDGLEFTKQLMANYPKPILVVSASVQKEDTHTIFQLLEAGAVDVFPKPYTGLASDYERAKQELITKIKILSGVTVFTRRQQEGWRRATVSPSTPSLATTNEAGFSFQSSTSGRLVNLTTPIRAIAIGASTGGPQALHQILTQLPVNFPLPVICTQHISEGFLQGLVDWLASECRLPVQVAQHSELPLPGTIYFAPERNHLELDEQGKFRYSISPPVDGHRPSVTVTFKSVVNFYSRATAGILLTGMGRDGAAGMQTIMQAGGVTIAQDEKSCVVFGMPKEAIALGGAQHILPLPEIAPLLMTKVFSKNSAIQFKS